MIKAQNPVEKELLLSLFFAGKQKDNSVKLTSMRMRIWTGERDEIKVDWRSNLKIGKFSHFTFFISSCSFSSSSCSISSDLAALSSHRINLFPSLLCLSSNFFSIIFSFMYTSRTYTRLPSSSIQWCTRATTTRESKIWQRQQSLIRIWWVKHNT